MSFINEYENNRNMETWEGIPVEYLEYLVKMGIYPLSVLKDENGRMLEVVFRNIRMTVPIPDDFFDYADEENPSAFEAEMDSIFEDVVWHLLLLYDLKEAYLRMGVVEVAKQPLEIQLAIAGCQLFYDEMHERQMARESRF